jgi:radical SAM protein with 4Fe4S-binding SPASM domain
MGLWVVSKKKFDVARLKFLLENRLSSRFIASAMAQEPDGRIRLEAILDSYANGEKREGFVHWMQDFPIVKVLDVIRRGFNRTEEEFKEELKNPTIRRVIMNAVRSLQKYGVGTPQNFVAPIMVVWNYTYRCNLRCRHCYQNAGPLGSDSGSFPEMTTEQKLQFLEELAETDTPTIFFSGGEPLIARDFWDVAERAKERGFYISVASNGTLFTPEVAKRAADIEMGYAAISLDAADPEVHDTFRGIPGMWERTVKGIRNLIDAGVITCISYTFTRQTAAQFPKLLKLREELGAYKVIVYNYIPVGRGGFEDDPTPEMREELYRIMYDELEAGHHVVATTAPQFGAYCKRNDSSSVIISHYCDAKAEELGVIADVVGGCGAGRAYCAIQPEGRVTPCVYMPDLTVGNVLDEPFIKIWQESPVFLALRDRSDLEGACQDCEFKALCGGCRARAYAYFDNLKGPDPGCINHASLYDEFMEGLRSGEDPATAAERALRQSIPV